ncbi:ABC transporter ATP-binding protein [Phytomonospora sp. NPDC050363]|uniref:ABC transporter ATP-binding protein n=1 Tax=Phytomonospora sp. NPDC050363 TaxID=3155642 RepID=UPI0033C401E4
MASVEVRGLRKRYGRTTALDDVSFEVADGEFFCLLGPSGAGKTTTLKTLAGLVEPDAGEVVIDGLPSNDVEPTHRGLAMCFESYALYPQLDVYGNLASPLRSPLFRLPASEVDAKVRAVAGTLGIDGLLERPVTRLSNGQRQRVALGRVLVRPARAYLLDEPLAHLDAKIRASMRAELKTISRDLGTTTVYVTHDYVEALSLADRIGVIRDGRILQAGTPEEVWARPVDAFVARAFGKPRMTLVGGGLTDSADGPAFVSDDGALRLPLPPVDAAPGEAVQVGVRPRDLRLRLGADEVPEGWSAVEGRVWVLEHLGRATEVTVAVGAARLAVVAPRAAVAGLTTDDRVSLLIRPSTVHVFATGDEGKRVSP